MFVDDDEIDDWINQGVKQAWQSLVNADPDRGVTTTTVVTSAGQELYALPTDFMSVRGLDFPVSSTVSVDVTPYEFKERNQLNTDLAVLNESPIKYRIALAETGLLTLSTQDYQCTVSTSDLSLDAPVGRVGGKDDLEISALFASAAGTGNKETRSSSLMKRSATEEQSEPAPPSFWRLSIVEAGQEKDKFSGAENRRRGKGAAEVGRQLHALVTEKYRGLIEESCGPLPEPLPKPD